MRRQSDPLQGGLWHDGALAAWRPKAERASLQQEAGRDRLARHRAYAVMQRDLQVFADARFQRHDKRNKLPAWITSHLKDSHLNLSTDMLLHIAREFMRTMAQPYNRLAVGESLLTQAQADGLNPAML